MTEKVLRADARRNLELILHAAGEAFAEGGLEVCVADIARRAGVGTATIFRRFPSKEDLVCAVLESRLRELLAIARECAEMPPGIETVRVFLVRAVEFQMRDRGFLEGAGKRMFAADERFAQARDEIFAALERMVDQAKDAGELREDIAATDLPVLVQAVGHGAALAQDLWRRYVDLVVDGMRPGAAPLTVPPPTIAALDAAHQALEDPGPARRAAARGDGG